MIDAQALDPNLDFISAHGTNLAAIAPSAFL